MKNFCLSIVLVSLATFSLAQTQPSTMKMQCKLECRPEQQQQQGGGGQQHGPCSTDLLNASYSGDAAKVKTLLQSGADPNCTPAVGSFSPLVASARNGYLPVVQDLVAAKADVCSNDNSRDKTALLASSFKDHSDVTGFLLKNGGDKCVNTQGVNGWTPCHDAAYIGSPVIVKQVIDAGQDLTILNENGETCLATAQRGLANIQPLTKNKTTTHSAADYRQVIAYIQAHMPAPPPAK